MDEIRSFEAQFLENQTLDQLIESKQSVRMIFVTGYQALVQILDYDENVIKVLAIRTNGDKTWMVYRTGICTVELE